MKFTEITLPVHNPQLWGDWLRDVLGAPAEGDGVRIGWTHLRFDSGTGGDRTGHHLAFAIPTGTITDAAGRVEAATGRPLLDDAGETVIDRGGHWASRSIYFHGPEGSVLELIEHADRSTPPTYPPGTLLGVAEIGRGVPDVAAAGDALTERHGALLPHGFGDPKRRVIAAYGDIDGAIVLARGDRPWYPTRNVLPATVAASWHGEQR